MSKIVYKLKPGDNWRIGEHESWLSDMALKGLYLERVGLIFARFRKGEPGKLRYRIEISQGKAISREQKEMYLESGWNYVTTYGDFNVFSSYSEEDVPELHTDPAEQSYTLSYLERKLKKSSAIAAGALVLVAVSTLFTFKFTAWTPYLSLIEGNFVQYLSILIESALVFMSLQAVISIIALRKTLLEGRAINHSAAWKGKFGVNIIVKSIMIGVLSLSVAFLVIKTSTLKPKVLPVSSTDLPIVRLAEVENNSNLERKTWIFRIKGKVDWGNSYMFQWSPFSPVQYVAHENGVVENEMWTDGSNLIYTPSINTWMYKLNFPSMGEKVLQDLIKRYSIVPEYNFLREMKHPGFDKLIVYEGDSTKEVFAIKGKAVIYIRYNGKANINSIIEAGAEKIALISY